MGEKIYYKLSDYDALSGIVGHECVNEIIAQRLMILRVHARPRCRLRIIMTSSARRVRIRSNSFVGWDLPAIYDMLFIDFLILNRDRRGANIEVLLNNRDGSVRIAPLSDQGRYRREQCI